MNSHRGLNKLLRLYVSSVAQKLLVHRVMAEVCEITDWAVYRSRMLLIALGMHSPNR